MRASVYAFFFGILCALGGLAYSAFVTLREWTLLAQESIATHEPSTVRVPAKAGRPYWAAIELRGSVTKKPLDHDIAWTATALDASNTTLRSIDVHIVADKPLPTCVRFSDEAPCAVLSTEGPQRDRITITLQVAPVTATKTGDLSYLLEVGKDARGGVTIEHATVTVYRSSREEAIAGLLVALVGLMLAGIGHRMRRRT